MENNKKLSKKVVMETKDDVIEIAANIDDQAAEELAPVLDMLISEGAYDAYFEPIVMKKNRLGTKLSVLCSEPQLETLVYIILKHTNTAGVRYHSLQRTIMKRSFELVQTEFGSITVKVLRFKDIVKIKPEYEDCLNLAQKNNVSIERIRQAVFASYQYPED